MDSLSELPVNDGVQLSQQESSTIAELFPVQGDSISAKADDSKTATGSKRKLNLKALGYMAVLFIILANPWIDSAICKIPKCESAGTVFAVKLTLFLLGMVMIQMFLI